MTGVNALVPVDGGKALGYVDTAWAIRVHVDAEDKQSVSLGLPGRTPTPVNESGMYSLIVASKQAQAREYKRWVTKQVLPAIRRDGGYMTPEVGQRAVDDPATFMAQAPLIADDTISRLRTESRGMSPANPQD